MNNKKYKRLTALVMLLLTLTIITTSEAALAADEISYNPGNNHAMPIMLVHLNTLSHTSGESSGLPYISHNAPEEPTYYMPTTDYYTKILTHPIYEAQHYPDDPPEWHKLITGSFYSINILTMEYGTATAIITQCTNHQFYATSRNSMRWEITGIVGSQCEYMYDQYYQYKGTIAVPYVSLSQAGIIRIERLPFHVDDGIQWVGFAIMEDFVGNKWREQIRIVLDGNWLNPLPPEATPAISDLRGFGWAREAIEFIVARDLMSMYPCAETGEPTAFLPSEYATRGYVLAAAVKALGLSVPYFTEAVHTPFYDVPQTGRGIYIDTAKQLGLVVGVGRNNFAPDSTITRQDMMTMLYNIMMAMGQIQPDVGLTALGRFSDFAEISGYARLPISSLAKAGIISGDGTSINPRGYVTRVEAAMFVRNLYMVV